MERIIRAPGTAVLMLGRTRWKKVPKQVGWWQGLQKATRLCHHGGQPIVDGTGKKRQPRCCLCLVTTSPQLPRSGMSPLSHFLPFACLATQRPGTGTPELAGTAGPPLTATPLSVSLCIAESVSELLPGALETCRRHKEPLPSLSENCFYFMEPEPRSGRPPHQQDWSSCFPHRRRCPFSLPADLPLVPLSP